MGGEGQVAGGDSTTTAASLTTPAPLHPRSPAPPAVGGRWSPIVLILLVAFALRVWNLTGIPPGLTHDEANHGREAIGILNGVLLYFFPLNYGSEPIYSYTCLLYTSRCV